MIFCESDTEIIFPVANVEPLTLILTSQLVISIGKLVNVKLPSTSVVEVVTVVQVDEVINFFSKITGMFLAPEPVTLVNVPPYENVCGKNTPPKFSNVSA